MQPAPAPLVETTPPQPQPLPWRSDRLQPPSPAPPPRRSMRGPKPRDFLYLALVSAFVADAFPTQVTTHLPLFDPIMGLQDHIPASFATALGYSQGSIRTPLVFSPKPNPNSSPIPTHFGITKQCRPLIAPTSKQQ